MKPSGRRPPNKTPRSRKAAAGATAVPKVLRTDPRKPLLDELLRLRTLLREIAETYVSRVEGEIAQIRDLVQDEEPSRARDQALPVLLECLRRLNVKPDKGRRRDLKRIDDLVREMRRLSESW